MGQALRCPHCGDAIGVYEPLVVLAGERARETSMAAEPELYKLPAPPRETYHRSCWVAARGPLEAT
jgi:hypothetical protein